MQHMQGLVLKLFGRPRSGDLHFTGFAGFHLFVHEEPSGRLGEIYAGIKVWRCCPHNNIVTSRSRPKTAFPSHRPCMQLDSCLGVVANLLCASVQTKGLLTER